MRLCVKCGEAIPPARLFRAARLSGDIETADFRGARPFCMCGQRYRFVAQPLLAAFVSLGSVAAVGASVVAVLGCVPASFWSWAHGLGLTPYGETFCAVAVLLGVVVLDIAALIWAAARWWPIEPVQ